MAAPSIVADLYNIFWGTKAGDPARYLDVFSPLRTDRAALSPDGRFLAYVVREGEDVSVRVVSVDPADKPTPTVLQAARHDPDFTGLFERSHPLRWLGWVGPDRLVFEVTVSEFVESITATNTGSGLSYLKKRFLAANISATNADGSDARQVVATRNYREAYRGRNIIAELRIVGPDPDRPGAFLLGAWAYGGPSNRFPSVGSAYSVDAVKGTRTEVSHAQTHGLSSVLIDSRGRLRLRIDRWDSTRFPQPFIHLSPDRSYRERPLDEVDGLSGFALSPDSFWREGSVPLGFDVLGGILYYASNIGRDTHGIYAVDLGTGQRQPGMLESPDADLYHPQFGTFGGPSHLALPGVPLSEDYPIQERQRRWLPSDVLVTDRFTQKLAGVRYEGATRTAVWYEPELQAVQDWLSAHRPGLSAEILEWDESRNRYLVREQGPADPGGYYVLDHGAGTYTQYARRGADAEAGSVARLTPFAFTLPDGSKVDGLLALPKEARLKNIPLVLLCPDYPWQRRGAGYQPEFEALTRMGLAVAIYNGRGAWGKGIREREKLLQGYEEVQAADAVAVADHLAKTYEVSGRRVALVGRGHGGFVALRALQLHPERFRCAVTMEALVDPQSWLATVPEARLVRQMIGDEDRLKAAPLVKRPEAIGVPVLTIVSRRNGNLFHTNARLHAAVKRQAPESELLEAPERTGETPRELAKQWARVETFLNHVLYDYQVDFGDAEVRPDGAEEDRGR